MIARMMMLQVSMAEIPPVTLKLLPPERRAPSGGEIVVCGRSRPDRFRLRNRDASERETELLLPKAEMRVLGTGTLGVVTEQVTLPQGATSNRLMLRLKWPL